MVSCSSSTYQGDTGIRVANDGGLRAHYATGAVLQYERALASCLVMKARCGWISDS